MTEATQPLQVLDRIVGVSSGEWDQPDTFAVVFYNYEPTTTMQGLGFAPGNLFVDYEEGVIALIDDEGETVNKLSLVDTLVQLPRKVPQE